MVENETISIQKLNSKVKLYKGDCLKIIKQIPDNSIDLTITDPPYGINLTPQRDSGKFKNTKVINDDNLIWLPNFVDEVYRVSKNVVCVFCGWQTIDKFKQAFEQRFVVKNILIWNKDWFGMGNNYRPNYELILLLCKTNVKTKSKNKSNILTYRRIAPQKMIHSCEKPIPLLEDLILELSDTNDTILDCFMGSGSTGEASIKNNRSFIGIELDENYYNIAENRINQAIENKETQNS